MFFKKKEYTVVPIGKQITYEAKIIFKNEYAVPRIIKNVIYYNFGIDSSTDTIKIVTKTSTLFFTKECIERADFIEIEE